MTIFTDDTLGICLEFDIQFELFQQYQQYPDIPDDSRYIPDTSTISAISCFVDTGADTQWFHLWLFNLFMLFFFIVGSLYCDYFENFEIFN